MPAAKKAGMLCKETKKKKIQTDRQTDRQTDIQTDIHRRLLRRRRSAKEKKKKGKAAAAAAATTTPSCDPRDVRSAEAAQPSA